MRVLGAAGLGDLGTHFPPDDERWRDADSLDLLRTVLGDARRAGRQRRRHGDLRGAKARSASRARCERNLSEVVGAPVSVKATTNEGMGCVGRGEGIACIAVAARPRVHRRPRVVASAMDLDRPMVARPKPDLQARRPARQRRRRPVHPEVLAEAGVDPARCGPTSSRGWLARYARWGASPATAADHRRRDHASRDESLHRDELGSLTFGELDRRSNALARALSRGGRRARRRRRDHGPQPPRLRRRDARRLEARRQRPLHEHRFLRPAARRRDGARGPRGPDLRRGVLRAARARPMEMRRASSPGSDGEAPTSERSDDRRADRGRRRVERSTRPSEVRPLHRSSPRARPARRRAPSAAARRPLSPLAALFSRIPLRASATRR